MMRTDNTVLTNGIIKNGIFYPKKNLSSGTLRIVLTTECNYKCKYCFAEGEKNKEKRILKLDDLKEIIKVGKEFGITNIKLTGGEPLMYPQMDALLAEIRKLNIPYVDMTTNISCLNEENIEMLNKYNVNALTLSLNSLEEKRYQELCNYSNFQLIKNNLNNVVNKFKGKIRINCIVFDYKYSIDDYDNIVEFCKKNNLGLRIVEPSIVKGLPITYGKESFHKYIKHLKSQADKIIESDCKSVEYLFFDNWYLTIMHSLCDNKLCDTCKDYMYIRVSSELKLKPCLSRRDTEVPIKEISEQSIKESYIEAIQYMGIGVKDNNE